MTVVVSMLRAVNLAGHNRMRMDALRVLYESLGLVDVQTYVQSGNVVFRTSGRDLTALAKRIENGIERSFGFRAAVIVRTCPELKDVLRRNPFAARTDVDPARLLVVFLAGHPDEEARRKISEVKVGPEELSLDGRELYIHYPNGIGRSKLTVALVEKALRVAGTGRNWNTVTKLLEMAERLESRPSNSEPIPNP